VPLNSRRIYDNNSLPSRSYTLSASSSNWSRRKGTSNNKKNQGPTLQENRPCPPLWHQFTVITLCNKTGQSVAFLENDSCENYFWLFERIFLNLCRRHYGHADNIVVSSTQELQACLGLSGANTKHKLMLYRPLQMISCLPYDMSLSSLLMSSLQRNSKNNTTTTTNPCLDQRLYESTTRLLLLLLFLPYFKYSCLPFFNSSQKWKTHHPHLPNSILPRRKFECGQLQQQPTKTAFSAIQNNSLF
jgi:hypothetical protein